MIPPWAQTLAWWIGALIAAGVLWKQVVRPLLRAVALAERMLPLLTVLTQQFEDTPGAFKVLAEIAAEFRGNGGASLRDTLNRLDVTLKLLDDKAKTLEIRDEEDRTRAARVAERVDQLTAKVDSQIEAGAARAKALETLAAKVADADG